MFFSEASFKAQEEPSWVLVSSFVGLFFNARFADAFVSVVGERKLLRLFFRRNYKENEKETLVTVTIRT